MSGVLVWIGAALVGGVGALARFHLDAFVELPSAGEFPLGTLVVNLLGAFCLGLLTGLSITGDTLLVAGTALLGSFTTFSTVMLETERLGEEGERRARARQPGGLVCRRPRGRDRRLDTGGCAVNDDCLKLTVHFGESDRVGHELLSDALMDVFERQRLHAAVLMRAVEGFGIKQQLRTDRLLTLSEDLPLVAVAVDERPLIEAVLPEVTDLLAGGLITLERARLLHDGLEVTELPEELHEATKLTVYLGRDERVAGRPAFAAVVDYLHQHGLAGATVLLGVDGMAHRRRRRARFFSRNEAVPVMIISVGDGHTIAQRAPRAWTRC